MKLILIILASLSIQATAEPEAEMNENFYFKAVSCTGFENFDGLVFNAHFNLKDWTNTRNTGSGVVRALIELGGITVIRDIKIIAAINNILNFSFYDDDANNVLVHVMDKIGRISDSQGLSVVSCDFSEMFLSEMFQPTN